MRVLALAALGAGLAFAAAAEARTWTDPEGRFVFDAPAGWVTTVEHSGDYTYVVTGSANNECHIASQPVAETATASASAVRRTMGSETQFDAAFWASNANGFGRVFPNDSANVLSHSVDTSQFWPIQRAEIQSPRRLVHGALQLRPGFQITTFCMTYEGPDTTAVYDAVIRSVAHPNDATFQAEAERQDAERAAAQAAQQQQQQQPEQGDNRRRRQD